MIIAIIIFFFRSSKVLYYKPSFRRVLTLFEKHEFASNKAIIC